MVNIPATRHANITHHHSITITHTYSHFSDYKWHAGTDMRVIECIPSGCDMWNPLIFLIHAEHSMCAMQPLEQVQHKLPYHPNQDDGA